MSYEIASLFRTSFFVGKFQCNRMTIVIFTLTYFVRRAHKSEEVVCPSDTQGFLRFPCFTLKKSSVKYYHLAWCGASPTHAMILIANYISDIFNKFFMLKDIS